MQFYVSTNDFGIIFVFNMIPSHTIPDNVRARWYVWAKTPPNLGIFYIQRKQPDECGDRKNGRTLKDLPTIS